MSANTSPIFPLVPVIGAANISSAVTGLTVSGVTGLTSLLAAGTNGTRVDTVEVQATGNTTANMVRLWVYAGSGNAQLFKEVPIPVNTASASNPAVSVTVPFATLVLPTGYTLYASTNNAEAYNVLAFGGNY